MMASVTEDDDEQPAAPEEKHEAPPAYQEPPPEDPGLGDMEAPDMDIPAEPEDDAEPDFGDFEVDVEDLIEQLEKVVQEALASDDEDALDLENITLKIEANLGAPATSSMGG